MYLNNIIYYIATMFEPFQSEIGHLDWANVIWAWLGLGQTNQLNKREPAM